VAAGAPTHRAARGAPRGRSPWREWLSSYAFIVPNLLGFLSFTLVPVIASLCLSFVRWDVIRPIGTAEYVGLDNFRRLLGFRVVDGLVVARDAEFWQYAYNTVFFMLSIPAIIIGALLCALLMNQKLRGIVAYRTVYFLPTICPAIAVCLLWQWILNSQWGLLNQGLLVPAIRWVNGLLGTGLAAPEWLTDPRWAKPALMLMGVWSGIGGTNCILYLAGLQGIPQELYEAADIDGATWLHKLRHITWPMLAPTTFFITTMSVIGGFQGGFMSAYIMTQGGPAGATTTIVYYIYNQGFRFLRMGYAAAIAWVLFAAVLAITLLTWRYGGRRVHYD
jgi:multiple sugar transport system permease protein